MGEWTALCRSLDEKEGERGREGFVFEITDLFTDCRKRTNREGEVEGAGERRNEQGSTDPE